MVLSAFLRVIIIVQLTLEGIAMMLLWPKPTQLEWVKMHQLLASEAAVAKASAVLEGSFSCDADT